jgi:endonuclease G
MKKRLFKYLALLALVVSLQVAPSCNPRVTPPPDDTGERAGAPDWVELPVMKNLDGVEYLTYYVSNDGMRMAEPTDPKRKRNMTMAFDIYKHAPLWVAYPMHTWYWTPRTTGRTNTWDWDPTLPQEVQPDIVTNGSYWQGAPDGPFSRGHLLASADRLRSVAMNTQTFYVTNLAPQENDAFNGTVWADLEFAVRDWSGSGIDTLYCVTGLAYELVDGKERVTYDKRTPRMEVKVPSHFYKVLLQRKDLSSTTPISQLPASELRSIGFWFENRAHPAGTRFEDGAVRVSDIEKRVGLHFFPMLSRDGEMVKQTLIPSDWGID